MVIIKYNFPSPYEPQSSAVSYDFSGMQRIFQKSRLLFKIIGARKLK
jgi:hypothetical protein